MPSARRGLFAFCFFSLFVVASCGEDETPPQAPPQQRPLDYRLRSNPGRLSQGLTGTPPKRTIYLNGKGVSLKGGDDDSSLNTSSLIAWGSTASLPAYSRGSTSWATVLNCVKSQFAAYNVTVTDVDPGSATHVEAVLGGSPSAVGMQTGVLGVSPMDEVCGVIEKDIVLVFEKAHTQGDQEICETAAHEIGHAFGLDHEFYCPDPMTYLYGCGNKSFQDLNKACGEESSRACQCTNPFTGSSSTQNTRKYLTQQLGSAATTCTPTTCAAQGKNCGSISNGCGGTLTCGSCATGQTCSSNVCATSTSTSCAHNVCTSGAKLASGCNTCVTTVCAQDSYCCTTGWDSQCVSEATSWCGQCQTTCTPTTCAAQGKNCGSISNGCGGTQSCGSCSTGQTCSSNVCTTSTSTICSHGVCATGTKLASSCSACAGKVCTNDPYCCATQWDSQCVSEAKSWCGLCQ